MQESDFPEALPNARICVLDPSLKTQLFGSRSPGVSTNLKLKVRTLKEHWGVDARTVFTVHACPVFLVSGILAS